MPSRAGLDVLNDELDEFAESKIRYFRTVEQVIRDGVIEEEERARLALARQEMKARFRVVARRADRIASGNRLLRLIANTGEITPTVQRMVRELSADQARIIEFPGHDEDGPQDDGAALAA